MINSHPTTYMEGSLEIDSCCCWLTFSRPSKMSADDLEKILGFPTNKPARHRGRKTPVVVFLSSDVEIDVSEPSSVHIQWMLATCEPFFSVVQAFAEHPGCRVELFILLQTDHDFGYVDIPSQYLRQFVNAGIDLSIKVERYGDEPNSET